MTILYFLIGCSVLMALIFLGAFFWALKSGQHDDVCTPAIRILFDDKADSETADTDLKEDANPTIKKTDANHFSV